MPSITNFKQLMNHNKFIAAILLGICCCTLNAQNLQGNFKKFTEKEGLSSNHVECFLKDKKGFLWVGTAFGLNRFDGIHFEKFLHSNEQPNTISNNVVHALVEDKEGNIWIGTEGGGLNKFNPSTKRFTVYKTDPNKPNSVTDNVVLSLKVDSRNKLWIGYKNNGWSILDIATNQFKHETSGRKYINRWGENSCDAILGFAQASNAGMWVLSGNGLFYKENEAAPPTIYIDNTGKFNFESENVFRQGVLVNDSLLLMATWGCGIKCFNTKSKKFDSYLFDKQYKEGAFTNVVLGIHTKSMEELWVASADRGVGIFNIQTKTFQFFAHDPENINSPFANECRAVFSDNEGLLWAAFDKGVTLWNPSNQNFQLTIPEGFTGPKNNSKSVLALYHDVPNHLIYYSRFWGKGLYIKDVQTNVQSLVPFPKAFCESNGLIWMDSISQLMNGNLLLQTSTGWYSFNKQTKAFTKAFPSANGNKINVVGTLSKRDAKGNAWCIDNTGNYYKINPATLQVLDTGGTISNRKLPAGPGIFIVAPFNDSMLWMHDRNLSLFLLHTKQNRIDTNYMSAGLTRIYDAKAMAIDKRGHIWVTCFSSGIYELWQLKNGKFTYKHYSETEGLPAMFLSSIIIDSKEQVWVAADKGIIGFNAREPVFKSYANEDGYSEKWYENLFLYLDESETLFAGHTQGFAQWPTNKMLTNKFPPPIAISSFKIFDKPWNDTLDINQQKEISLNYDQNFISVEFSALNFINPQQNKYAYKLDGVDKDWVYCGSRQFVSYANLKDGSYTLHIKASNNDGVWNEKGFSLQINIAAPFWQTWWFYLLLILLVTAIVVGIYRYRIATIRREEKIKTQYNKKVAEIEMKALRAQMNPHFIFNCLTSINRYIVKSDHITASGYLTRFAKLIRLILDSSASETTSLESEIQLLQLYIEMEMLRFDNRFNVQLQVDKTIDQSTKFIPSMLIQPYIENAIWHGLLHKEGKGNLKLIFTEESNNVLKVIIEDDGIGRQTAAELKSKQVLKEKSYGMKITGDRINMFNELHGIKASSHIEDLKDGNGHPLGTRVILMLPFETEIANP
jgi:ligand-binding sensor domain-containing protein